MYLRLTPLHSRANNGAGTTCIQPVNWQISDTVQPHLSKQDLWAAAITASPTGF